MKTCPRCGDEFNRPRCDLCVNCTRAVRRAERRAIGGGSTGLPKRLDGFRFGRLVVLGPAVERIGTGLSFWCQCDCGRERLCRGFVLNRGELRSCGECRVADFEKPAEPVMAFERKCETCELPFWSTLPKKHCCRKCRRRKKRRSQRRRLVASYVRDRIAQQARLSAKAVCDSAVKIYRSHLRLYRQGKSNRLVSGG